MKKKIASDLVYSVLALCIMHGVLQILVYPSLNRLYGSEQFGSIVSAYGMITIFSASAGLSINNIRLKSSKENGLAKYYTTVALLAVFGMLLSVLFSFKIIKTGSEMVGFMILAVVTTLRSYCDVYYRETLDYAKYFVYYLVLSIGCIGGLFIGRYLDNWTIVFIAGETLALVFLLIDRGKVFLHTAKDNKLSSTGQKDIFVQSFLLYLSFLIYYIALNFDKIILLYLMGGNEVTIYYVASICGKTFSLLVGSLNAILLSYLAKMTEPLSKKLYKQIIIAISLLGGVAFLACLVGTPLIASILYPGLTQEVREIAVIANLGQVFCFMSSLIITIILYLSNSRIQLIVQIVFTVLVVGISPALVYVDGVRGYSVATLLVYVIKYIVVILIGYKLLNRFERNKSSE